MIEILLALLAGMLTIAAPCILLPLPILFGSSIGKVSKTRPLFITMGFVASFAILGLALNFFVQHLGLSANALRNGAAIVLAIFGLFMVWPTPFEKFSAHFSKIITRAGQAGKQAGSGNVGGFIIGVLIGIVWAPCAGPILGSILTLIARQQNVSQASILLIAYAIGAGIPMLIIAYGGQYITTRIRKIAQYSTRIQQIFGIIIIVLAIAIFFQYDTYIEARLIQHIPFLNPKL